MASKGAPKQVLTEDHDLFRKVRIGIVTASWNPEITGKMLNGALEYLRSKGIKDKNITFISVPGSFELPLGASLLAKMKNMDGVIALGCIIQGETRHFEFIASACASGIMQVNMEHKKPVAFGVLTTENHRQARERAGGKHGNKGSEAAESVLTMLRLADEIS